MVFVINDDVAIVLNKTEQLVPFSTIEKNHYINSFAIKEECECFIFEVLYKEKKQNVIITKEFFNQIKNKDCIHIKTKSNVPHFFPFCDITFQYNKSNFDFRLISE